MEMSRDLGIDQWHDLLTFVLTTLSFTSQNQTFNHLLIKISRKDVVIRTIYEKSFNECVSLFKSLQSLFLK